MTTLYEIECDGPGYDAAPYYSTTIVAGPTAPAGTVPECVHRHARLLACIAGSRVLYRIGTHEPTVVTDTHTRHATTIWLTEPRGASQRDRFLDGLVAGGGTNIAEDPIGSAHRYNEARS